MRRRLTFVLGLLAAGLAACNETEKPAPTAPSFAGGPNVPPPGTCNLNAVKSLITQEFDSPEQQAGLSYYKLIASSPNQPSADPPGFDLFDLIARTVDAGRQRGTPQVGSDLTNNTLWCLSSAITRPPGLPTTIDFTIALSPALGGIYAVRGGRVGSTASVLARHGAYSGLGLRNGATWDGALGFGDELPVKGRTLIWGQPNLSSAPTGEPWQATAFDWFTIPHHATVPADGGLIVGFCSANPNLLVQEAKPSSATVLRPLAANFLDDAGPCSPTGATGSLGTAATPRWLARLVGLTADLVLPAAARAAVVSPGGTGGLPRGFSAFGPVTVTSLSVSFQPPPIDDGYVSQTITSGGGPVRVLVATANGTPIDGASVTMTFINNNGVPATLLGDTELATGADGVAAFGNLSLTKTGGYRLVATVRLRGQSGQTILSAQATSNQFNIRP